jgi:23S rRNA (cytosine1962-C5)-methyltransferase
MTANTGHYELLDFGGGRKLERFGDVLVDRPCPSAEQAEPSAPSQWALADARFERSGPGEGRWALAPDFPRSWSVSPERLCLELRAAAGGQVGLFPEQFANWGWIRRQVTASGTRCAVLNLFGYTGGATLAAAGAGAQVVHVDASKSAVTWARRNAARSGLAEAPIRWIVEDAVKFVRREIRRENIYQGVILDPPSYGHGPKGRVWKIDRDLEQLLSGCAQLLDKQFRFLLLTCHTPNWDPDRLLALVSACFPNGTPRGFTAEPLQLRATDGRVLPCGVAVRSRPAQRDDHA